MRILRAGAVSASASEGVGERPVVAFGSFRKRREAAAGRDFSQAEAEAQPERSAAESSLGGGRPRRPCARGALVCGPAGGAWRSSSAGGVVVSARRELVPPTGEAERLAAADFACLGVQPGG